MQSSNVLQLIPVLQTAIGPAILISGTGLLLLTMTNRLGRAIDRARLLARETPTPKATAQLKVLWRRAKLIRLAIALAAGSALLAVALIVALFLTAWLQLDYPTLILTLFVLCVGCLAGSLAVFIHDINQSLAALHVELNGIE
jgi:ABC-type polysaccharide/polyol phosphate export permease